MNGIPVTILREGEPEKIYLSTRRSGKEGALLHDAKKAARHHHLMYERNLAKVIAISNRLENISEEKMDAIPDAISDLLEKMDELSGVAYQHKLKYEESALTAVTLSLKQNHGDDAEKILDCLTDAQILVLVTVIETGDVPADFFPSRDTRHSGSSISPNGGSVSAPSSRTDSPQKTSSEEGSR